MFEPRGTFHTVTLLTVNHSTEHISHKRRRRRIRQPLRSNDDHHLQQHHHHQQQQYRHGTEPDQEPPQQLYEQHYFDEPEMPIHPALEFEIETTERKESVSSLEGIDSILLLSSSSLSPTAIAPYTALRDETHHRTTENDLLVIQQQQYQQEQDTIPSQHLDSYTHYDTPLLLSGNSKVINRNILRLYQQNCVTLPDLYYWLSVICLIISGVGIAVTLKLQAIAMYNYPNFLNIYTNLLYIPFCYAYIVPITSSCGIQSNEHHSISYTSITLSSLLQLPSKSLLLKMMIIGILDAITATLQTFAAVYVPGPLLVLVPQAAIPVSMICKYCFTRTKTAGASERAITSSIFSMPAMGAIIILVGIFIVLEPVWSSQRAPDYYCEAIDPYNDCSICNIASTEMECAGKSTSQAHHLNVSEIPRASKQWLFNASSTDEVHPNSGSVPCQWIPFEESTKEKESLEVIWSTLLVLSTIPMAISAVCKQRAIHSLSSGATTQAHETSDSTAPLVASTPEMGVAASPVIFMSGWIAVFQLLASLILTIPAGIMSSPSIHPWKVPENLWNGILCYSGYPIVVNGCHPDTMCTSYHVALWINVGVICHVVYSVSLIVILQASSDCTPLFLALTATVPLGHLAFTLPLLPLSSQESLDAIDLIGLFVIISGLIMYRFSNDTTRCSKRQRHTHPSTGTDEESISSIDGSIKFLSQQVQSSISSLWMQVANQTSYTLLRETLDLDPNGNV